MFVNGFDMLLGRPKRFFLFIRSNATCNFCGPHLSWIAFKLNQIEGNSLLAGLSVKRVPSKESMASLTDFNTAGCDRL